MAHTIQLKNADGSIRVEVVPLHGGMIAQIYYHDREILHVNRDTLEYAPMAAGGNPFLFPFASKTREDRWRLNGKDYYMPVHGLVKNAPFSLRDSAPDAVTLYMEGNPGWMRSCFPFDFELELTYRVRKDSVLLCAKLHNRGNEPMPHSLGWHPYFLASDKARTSLTHNASIRYDYVDCIETPLPEISPLTEGWDDVFIAPGAIEFCFSNPVDGYSARMVCDEAFRTMVVCSNIPDSVCIEPWCGVPDSINNKRLLQYIAPGESRTYSCELQLKLI